MKGALNFDLSKLASQGDWLCGVKSSALSWSRDLSIQRGMKSLLKSLGVSG